MIPPKSNLPKLSSEEQRIGLSYEKSEIGLLPIVVVLLVIVIVVLLIMKFHNEKSENN